MGASGSKSNRRLDHKSLNTRQIKKLIKTRQLAPLFIGQDENDSGKLDECPICLLNFPALNHTDGCCGAAICTDCYLKVLYSRSEDTVQQCPFCNKPGYKVTYHGPKTEAARAAERQERDTVEHALVSARLGSLAAEWARAQDEDSRFMQQRESYWRDAIARHTADGGDGSEMDVEDLLVMQAMLASLEDQQVPSSDGAAGSGGRAADGSSGSREDHPTAASSSHTRSDAAADEGTSHRSYAGSSVPAASTHGRSSDRMAIGSGGGNISGHGVQQQDMGGTQEQRHDRQQQGFRLPPPASSSAEPAAGGQLVAAAAAPYQMADGATASRPISSALASSSAHAEPDSTVAAPSGVGATPASHTDAFLGSPALAQALAEANGRRRVSAAREQLLMPAARPAAAGSRQPLLTATELGSEALADALAAANGWATASQQPPAQQAFAGGSGRPVIIGMVLVHPGSGGSSSGEETACHCSPDCASPSRGGSTTDAYIAAASTAAAADGSPTPQPPSSGGAAPRDAASSAKSQSAAASPDAAVELPTVGPSGGVAIMRQPDQSTVLVLLRSGNTLPQAAAAPPQHGAPDVPLLELSYEDPLDRQIVDAILSGDAMVQRAFQRMCECPTTEDPDEAFRIAMEQHAAEDAVQQQAVLDADARLKAALEAADAHTSVPAF